MISGLVSRDFEQMVQTGPNVLTPNTDRPITAQPTGEPLPEWIMSSQGVGPIAQGTGCYRKMPTCRE